MRIESERVWLSTGTLVGDDTVVAPFQNGEKVMILKGEALADVDVVDVQESGSRVVDVSTRTGKLLIDGPETGVQQFDPETGEFASVSIENDLEILSISFADSDDSYVIQTYFGLVVQNGDGSQDSILLEDGEPFGSGSMVVSNDGNYATVIYEASRYTRGYLIDLAELSVRHLGIPYLSVSVFFSPDGKRLFCAGSDSSLDPVYRLAEYDISTGEIYRKIDLELNPFAQEPYGDNIPYSFSLDSKKMAFLISDNAYVVDLEKWEIESVFHRGEANGMLAIGILLPESELLLPGNDGDVAYFSISSGTPIAGELVPVANGTFEARIDSKLRHHYRYEFSSDLVDWQLEPEGVEGDGETLSIHLPEFVDGGSFMRLFAFPRD